MYQDIANTADNIKESWTTRFRTREPLRAWFLAMNDEQSGARAIEGMRGPMGFRRNTIRFDSVHQLRINKFAPSGWTLRQWAKEETQSNIFMKPGVIAIVLGISCEAFSVSTRTIFDAGAWLVFC